jgi:hypothetical protein
VGKFDLIFSSSGLEGFKGTQWHLLGAALVVGAGDGSSGFFRKGSVLAGGEEDARLQCKDDKEVEDTYKAAEAEEACKKDEVEAACKAADAEDTCRAADAEEAHKEDEAEAVRKEADMEGVRKTKVKKSRKRKAPEDGLEADEEGAAHRTARARKTPSVCFIDLHYGLSDFNCRRLKQNIRRNGGSNK